MILENQKLRLCLDDTTGSITQFCNLETGWELIRQPALAMGIALRIPIAGHRSNMAESSAQKLSCIERPDGQTAVLRWAEIEAGRAGKLPIAVEMTVSLEPDGGASFAVAIENHSDYTVEEVWAPCLGGVREPAGSESISSLTMHFQGGLTSLKLGDSFPLNDYWGIDYPTVIRTFPAPEVCAPFILLQREQEGIYWGVHNPEPEIACFVHSFKPGYLDSKHYRLPEGDMLGGNPAGFCISTVRLPCIQPGESRCLAPVVITPYSGDWHRGVSLYREWDSSWYQPAPQPAWTRETDCWMTLQMNSSEGCCRYRYRDLPAVMREAKEYGVQVLQLIGWATGGQDGYEPFQDTDPLLGTREELAAAIREIEAMGIRVLLMCKFKWADQSAPGFAEKMEPFVLRDMRGHPVPFGGYAYQNLFQKISGGSIHNGFGLCHSSAAYRKAALAELQKILDLRPSGILYDELANPMLCCFDTSHGHRPGESIHKGSVLLAREFAEFARKALPEFALAGEGPSDMLSQYYSISYIRSWDGNMGEAHHRPAWKYLHPEMQFATCLVGWDDREMVNQCLVYGYIINYEPYNFKGRMSDIPETAAYGQKIRQLRRKLWDYLWKGTFRHTDSLTVTGPSVNGEYIASVFEAADGSRAVALANQETGRSLTLRIALEGAAGSYDCYDTEGGYQPSDGVITIPPRSAVVLVERK